MATCATNIDDVNNFVDQYKIAATAPSGPSEGDLWCDTTANILKVHNGTSFVAVTSATSGITDVVDDTSPSLGGDLELNGNSIDFPTTPNISDCLDEDTMSSDSATKLATQQSIKAYADTKLANVSEDTTPQLGGNLDVNGQDIVSTSNADIDIIPNGTGDVNLGADTVQVGDNNVDATITTQGTGDLTLNTNNGSSSGNITLADGADGNIDLTTNGTGVINFNDLPLIPQQALTSTSGAVAWDAQAKPNAYHLTTENTAISEPSNAVEGAFICIEINYNGSHTMGWNAIFNFAADTPPTTTDTDGKTDILSFRYNGSIWQEIGRTLDIPES
jgi:hypothetical protein